MLVAMSPGFPSLFPRAALIVLHKSVLSKAEGRVARGRVSGEFVCRKRLAYSERCQLDLPGFKNLEGLHIGMFPY